MTHQLNDNSAMALIRRRPDRLLQSVAAALYRLEDPERSWSAVANSDIRDSWLAAAAVAVDALAAYTPTPPPGPIVVHDWDPLVPPQKLGGFGPIVGRCTCGAGRAAGYPCHNDLALGLFSIPAPEAEVGTDV